MPNTPLTVGFCIPGNKFSGRFLECWTNLMAWCKEKGIKQIISRQSSCNIYYVRNMCLGADVMRGPKQKPFNGKLEYDYLLWIDSDILFTPAHLERLLSHDKDIVSGIYSYVPGSEGLACGRWRNQDFLKSNTDVDVFTHEIVQKMDKDINGLIQVDYCGFGFMLIKKGVFESLDYPWFKPLIFEIGDIKDQMTDDMGFCYRIKQAGYNVFIDPCVRVGHEKMVAL